ncbi:MAG: hypothetical protein ACQESX_04835 [Bacteroidota bacterium]
MATDILFSLYIFLLFPLLYECEKLKSNGLKYLLTGVFFTPVIGYIMLYSYKRKSIKRKNSAV